MTGVMVQASAQASYLPSDPTIYSLERYSGPANPVGQQAGGSVQEMSLSLGSSPGILNPKLNTTPWAQSYAQNRTEPKSVKKSGWRKPKRKSKKT